MPEINDIDKLKQQLNSFGNEPAILESLGEEIEDIKPTPQELPDDISALLGDMDQTDDVLDDFFGTDALALDESADNLFDQMSGEGSDDADSGFDAEAMEERPEETEDEAVIPEMPDDFSFDELPEAADDFGDISWDSETDAEPETETETETEAEADTEPFEELPDYDMAAEEPDLEVPDFEEEAPLTEEIEIEPEEVEIPVPEEFDIGDLENISMDDDFDLSDDLEAPEADDFAALEDLGEAEELVLGGSPGGDEFSLEDLGEEFGHIDDLDDLSEKSVPEKETAVVSGLADHDETGGSLEFYISAEKLQRVTASLNNLPRNLKFFIEDLIGTKGLSGPQLDQLVDKLAEGGSVKEIANTVFHITGKRIRIPAQFERKTWEDLEKEKGTLAYVLRYKILPLTGRILAFSFLGLFVFFIVKTFIWEPVYSTYLYRKGFDHLVSDQFNDSERVFLQAVKVKPQKKQFFKYADAYRNKKEYARAEKKYTQLLGISLSSEREKPQNAREQGYFQGDKKGFLDYSFLKTYYQGDFESSESIIEDFLYLRGNKWDSEMLVYKIDNYLNWAAVKDSSKYVNAETVINDSIFKFGTRPDLFFRKIAVDLRSGKLDGLRNNALSGTPPSGGGFSSEQRIYLGVLGQYRGFIENIKKKNFDSYISADFYRYLIDKGDIEGVSSQLLNIIDSDRHLPEPYYQLSRVWKVIENPDNERKSLDAFEMALAYSSTDYLRDNYPHSYEYGIRMRKRYEVAAYNRLGDFHYLDENVLPAQRYYQKAISEYENNRSLTGSGPQYGYLYEDLGNIYYYSAGRFVEALEQFKKAAATGYNDDNLFYKIGYIYYRDKNYSAALEKFYDVLLNKRDNVSVLTAFSNASFNSGIYSPARAYLEQVKDKLEYWREIEGFIDIDNRRDHRVVLDKLMQVYNNLGVSLYMLAERGRNVNYYSNSLVYFTKSSEMYDLLNRNPETLVRSITRPLAQLNMRYALMNAGLPSGNITPFSGDGLIMDGPVIYNILDMDLSGRVEMITALE